MQPDLLGLEISPGELRRLTGFEPEDVFRPSVLSDRSRNGSQRWSFLLNEILVALALTPIIVGFIYGFLVLPFFSSSTVIGVVLLILAPLGVIIGRWVWRKFAYPQVLTVLLDEVDKYHALIQAIDINDQLADSGNTQNHLRDREKIIAALQLIREDLVRALKTERILRDNKKLLANNQELFVNNLANLQALQVSTQAGEYAQLLHQSFQIALDVQAELRKLQSSQ
ncbi:hypothetical protein [Calothrix sp. 336/3]|uniref:hypothetical protein n=1 Tax=Calothrix sp. 336/3 TaxID=1337936 RepID=UPI0004E2E366|nr:hypothetical protein [Calothrix sp. 336/3]AKG20201.1 hypothetical protein IJ00_01755 [Calothrix sp. 336/3]